MYFTYLNNICSIRCWHKIEWKPMFFGKIKTFLCNIVVNFGYYKQSSQGKNDNEKWTWCFFLNWLGAFKVRPDHQKKVMAAIKPKTTVETSGPSGRSLSPFLQHGATTAVGVFLLLMWWMLVHHRANLSIKFASTHLYMYMYTLVRGTVRVKHLT